MNNLNIIERHNRNVTVLDLAGKIRIGDDISKLRMALRVVMADGARNVLLNLAAITYIDSCGLGELVAGFAALQKSGGELKLVHLTDRVSDLLMITKLLTVFEVFENEEEAVNSFQKASVDFEVPQTNIVTGKLDKELLNTL